MQGLYQHNLPKDIKLFLAKPNKKVIAPLKFALQRTLKWNENAPNEINFSLPYEISGDHKMEKYEPVELLKEKFLIKAVSNEYEEWFIVSSYGKSSDDTDTMNVSCRSLESGFEKKKLINFERKSYNATMLLNDVLPGTGFKIGYINPNLNLKYREFDITSTSKLSFIYENMATTFEALVVFDTIEMTVNFYEKNELSKYKGFIINEKRYLIDIEENIDSAEIVTRLHVTGSDGLGIQSVNPTGQRYIDDFSYFLHPFEIDDKGKIIKSSYFMEDDLALALTRYNQYVSSRKDDFRNLLEEKSKHQEDLSSLQAKLFEYETDLQTILDTIKWMKSEGLNVDSQNKERKDNNNKVSNQKQKIKSVEDEIALIDDRITKLKKDLDMSNHLSPTLLDQLEYFIHEDEWDDNNKIDPNDLYESGIEKLMEINAPPINIQTSLASFLNDVNAKDDWERIRLSDIVRIQHRKIGIDARARISSIIIDYDNPSIDLEISNLRELNSLENEMKSAFYRIHKVDTDYNKRKINYEQVANNFNLRNDRVKEIPASPSIGNKAMSHKTNDDGSVDITVKWDFPDFDKTENNEHNIDGFMLYFYSDTSPDYYQFSSQMTNEQITTVPYASRQFVYPSLPANLYYTIGVRAYRRVDPDINRDSILLSPIVRFNDTNSSTVQMTQAAIVNEFSQAHSNSPSNISSLSETMPDEESNSPAYKPENTVNVNGKLNGKNYTVQNDEPSEPIVGDIWVSIREGKMRVWNGSSWTGDRSIDDLEGNIDDIVDQISDYETELREKIEESMREVDEAMVRVDSEMERIEKEVIPDVERAIKETYIPSQDSPPEVVPPSGLWWDTSQEPPRIMRWDEDSQDWVVLAPNQEEIDEIIDNIIESAKQEFKQYTDEEIEEMRKTIQDSLDEKTSQLNEKVADLLERASGLDDKVILIDNELDDQRQRVSQIVEDVSNKANIEWVDEQLSLRGSGIIQSPIPPENPKNNELWLDITTIPNVLKRWTGEEWEKASPTEANELGAYTFEQVDGALNSKVSNDTYIIDKDGFVERFETNELSISTLAGELEFKADQAILDTISDTVESHSTLLSIQAGLIESKVDSDYVDGELDEIRSYASLIEQTAQRVDTSLSSLIESHNELGRDVEKNTTDISIQAGLIEAKLDSNTYNRDKNDILTSIEQNTLDIQATAKGLEAKAESTLVDKIAGTVEGHSTEIELLAEGIRSKVSETFVKDAISEIEIGGRNLVGDFNLKHWAQTNNIIVQSSIGLGYVVKLQDNTNYTLHRRNSNNNNRFRLLFFDMITDNIEDLLNVESKKRIDHDAALEVTFNSENYKWVFVYLTNQKNVDNIDQAFIKLEKGTKATDYTCAEEDILLVQENHSTQIDQNSRQITLQSDFISNMEGVIRDSQADISILSDEINQRVKEDVFNAESDYLRSSIAEVNIYASGIEQTVKNIEIGGRNLVQNSAGNNLNDWIPWAKTSTSILNFNEHDWIRAVKGNGDLAFGVHTPTFNLKANKTYICSFTIRSYSNSGYSLNYLYLRHGKSNITSVKGLPNISMRETSGFEGDISGDGIRVWFTFNHHEYIEDARLMLAIRDRPEGAGFVIREIKISEGNNLSDWSPAIEDTDRRMTLAESSITQLSNQITTKVEQDGVISSINQTPESVGINAALIDFNGLAKFEPFSKNYYQNTVIANGNGGKWYRIAKVVGNGNQADYRAHAKFILRDITSSQHSTAVFEAGVNFGRNPYINLTSYGIYASASFAQARILTKGTYDEVYLEVYINDNTRAQSLAYWITENTQTSGWEGVNWTTGNIPSGYSPFNRNLDAENVIQGTVDKWKYGDTTLINGGEIYTNTVTANQLNVNNIFGNSAVIAKIQSNSVLTANLSATKITSGTLNAAQVSVINLSASSIISGTLDASKVNVRNLNASSIISGVLRSIEIEGVSISGSKISSIRNSYTHTTIEGGEITTQGRFTRTWRNQTATHTVRMMFENGQLRARNDSENHSLYFGDYGISTYSDALGNGAPSGTIAFRDNEYSTANGITINSGDGVVALRSDNNRIVVDAEQTINLESNQASIYFRPMKQSRLGLNEFRLWVKDNTDAGLSDGVLSYGSGANDLDYASGLRFKKSTLGDPIVYITNGNGDINSGKAQAESFIGMLEAPIDNAYIGVNDRLRITSKAGYNNGNVAYRDLQMAHAMVRSIRLNTEISGTHFYLGVSTGELRVTSNLLAEGSYRPIRVGEVILDGGGRLEHTGGETLIQGNSGIRATRVRSNTLVPMHASAFNSSSSIKLKTNIQSYTESGLDVINRLNIVNFDWIESPDAGRQIGVIAEHSPDISCADGTEIKLNDLTMYNTKSIQELYLENIELRQRIKKLEKMII